MTENKRFIQKTNLVMQNNEVYVVCGNEHSADVVTTALNELINENEQLKQQLQVCLEHHNCILETEKICVMCDECANLSMDYTNSIGGIL